MAVTITITMAMIDRGDRVAAITTIATATLTDKDNEAKIPCKDVWNHLSPTCLILAKVHDNPNNNNQTMLMMLYTKSLPLTVTVTPTTTTK